MKVLTRSIAFAGTLLAAPCAEAQNYFQRSTLFEHTEPTTGFELAVETADGGVLTTLDADTALYLVKLDPNGDLLWANSYLAFSGDTHWDIVQLSATADGGCIFIHDVWIHGPAFEENYQATLTRLDIAGQVLWSRKYTLPLPSTLNTSSPYPMLVTHPNGTHSVLFHGTNSWHELLLSIDDQGAILWSSLLNAWTTTTYDVQLVGTPNNGVLLLRGSGSFGGHISAVSYDQFGNRVWGTKVGMTNGSWEYANAKCAVTGSGAVYIVGSQHMPQQQHGYLVRLDPNGSLAWYKLFGDGLYLPFPIDPLQPGFELPNGDLEFGLRTRQFFTSAGVHLGGAARSLPTTVIGSEQFIRHTGYGERSASGFIVTGNYKRIDQLFNYTWTTPTIDRIPWDLTSTCGWTMDTTYAVADTLVPMAFIQVDTLPASLPQAVTVIDTTTIAVPANLTTFFDFCTLVGFEENTAHYHPELEVFPSPLAAGNPLHLRTSKAAEIIVVDARGRIVWRGRVPAGLTQIPTSGLASGLHLVQGIDGQGKALGSARFVVE
ncbi:MAG: hypothetical protein IPO12_17210 [Flavobacteriales bacterium]|nr:hypothetical protein [Flavobacteriales bacterium]